MTVIIAQIFDAAWLLEIEAMAVAYGVGRAGGGGWARLKAG